jgi:hypothetical protein
MIRTAIRAIAVGATALSTALIATPPAEATVHEIVAQWCSGHDELAPPGITGGSNADNFARPLAASGFITGEPVPFDPPGDQPAGLRIPFDYDRPNAKVVGTGVFIAIGATPAGPLYLELIEPDPSFAAFRHCPRLATG